MKIYKISQSNKIRLWLDDERDPKNKFVQDNFGAIGDEIWVKTPQEAIEYLKTKNVIFISFDHDLGHGLEGKEVSNWIEEASFNNLIPKLDWRVHSKNPVGANEIYNAMISAERFWNKFTKTAEKIRIFEEDYKKVVALVEKIISGYKDWTLEELQLQQNFPQVIEILLNKKLKGNQI